VEHNPLVFIGLEFDGRTSKFDKSSNIWYTSLKGGGNDEIK